MRVSKAWLSYHHTQENGLNNAFSFLKIHPEFQKFVKFGKQQANIINTNIR